MKKLISLIRLTLILLTASPLVAQQVVVTDDASYTTPAASSVLDVKSTSKGFLPPRVALSSRTDQSTIASPANGLLVFNTTVGNGLTKGLYFWRDSVWIKPLDGGSGSISQLVIDNLGQVRLNGSATSFSDLVVNPYTALNNGTTKPNWTLFVDPNMYTWEFIDGASNKELFFIVQLPHDYKEGSTIYPHVHWSSKVAAGTQRIKWVLTYQWVNHTENFAATSSGSASGYTLAGANPSRSVNAYEHVITPLGSGIDGTGKKISSILMCRLYRDGSDTTNDNFTGSGFLLSFDFHYEIDSFGSDSEYTK